MIERKKKYEERVTLTAEAVKYASFVDCFTRASLFTSIRVNNEGADSLTDFTVKILNEKDRRNTFRKQRRSRRVGRGFAPLLCGVKRNKRGNCYRKTLSRRQRSCFNLGYRYRAAVRILAGSGRKRRYACGVRAPQTRRLFENQNRDVRST